MSRYNPKQTTLQAAIYGDNGTAVGEILGRNTAAKDVSRDSLVTACRFGKLEAVEAIIQVKCKLKHHPLTTRPIEYHSFSYLIYLQNAQCIDKSTG